MSVQVGHSVWIVENLVQRLVERVAGRGLQIDLGWVVFEKIGVGWLIPLPMFLIHYQMKELADHLMMSGFSSLLSQGIEFHWISHHGKFWIIGGLCPRIGIPWIQVHNRRRSFLGSLARVYVSSFVKCAPKLDNQRLKGVRYQVFCLTRVLLAFYSQVFLLVWRCTRVS